MIGGKKDRCTVLVTDADRKNALAIIRCLSKKGYVVYVAGHKNHSMCFYSKFCKKKFIYKNPKDNSDDFIYDIEEIIRNHDVDILLPVSASTTIPISFYKKRLERHTHVPISKYETLEKAHNKYTMYNIAKECGVPIPKTYCPENIEELTDIAATVEYPVVLKPRKSSASRGLQYIYSEEELLKKYYSSESSNRSNKIFDYYKPLIQEYIPGEIHDVCLLCNYGKTKAGLTQRRIWTYPINGGGGVVNQTIYEPQLLEKAVKLTKKLKWYGVTQVEFKIDSRDNVPKLMEMNTKFWGTLELSIAAGIPFPELLCKMELEQDFEDIFKFKDRFIFIWTNSGFFSNFLQADSFNISLKGFKEFTAQKYTTNISFDDLLPHIFIVRDFFKSLKDTISLK